MCTKAEAEYVATCAEEIKAATAATITKAKAEHAAACAEEVKATALVAKCEADVARLSKSKADVEMLRSIIDSDEVDVAKIRSILDSE